MRFRSTSPSIIPYSSQQSSSQNESSQGVSIQEAPTPQPSPAPTSSEEPSHRWVHTVPVQATRAPAVHLGNPSAPGPSHSRRGRTVERLTQLADVGFDSARRQYIRTIFRDFVQERLDEAIEDEWLLSTTNSRLQQLLVQYMDRSVLHDPAEGDPSMEELLRENRD